MTPTELQSNFVQCVLYYCGFTMEDTNRYFTETMEGLSPTVGTININGNDDQFVETWQLGYAQPDNETLDDPDLADVLAWYNNNYYNPWLVMTKQCYPEFTSTQLSAMATDQLTNGMIVRNSTSHKLQRLSSGSWVDMW